MLKKLLMTAITAVALSSFAHAQESSHSLGFAAGSTYGVGLSYSHDWKKSGVQITALPYWNEDSGMVAAGVNFKRNFDENDKIGIYGSLGVATAIQKETFTECFWDEELNEEVCEDPVVTISQNFATGPGVGMQVYFWKNAVFRFELPLAFRFGTAGFGITPIPNVALMYRWQ
tara:strand:+ start:447 stop:965 length:519 start_codon:yes stop_codon:yes gene_type:complete